MTRSWLVLLGWLAAVYLLGGMRRGVDASAVCGGAPVTREDCQSMAELGCFYYSISTNGFRCQMAPYCHNVWVKETCQQKFNQGACVWNGSTKRCNRRPALLPVVNEGRNCALPCGGLAGPCSWCGTAGVCCDPSDPVGCAVPDLCVGNLCCAQPTPTSSPTLVPTKAPTVTQAPTFTPTTSTPTKSPTRRPTTRGPTTSPTKSPTRRPTTRGPTTSPTKAPTTGPTKSPTRQPTTRGPTKSPTRLPTTQRPTFHPTNAPTTSRPTASPRTSAPTRSTATNSPTREPTHRPSNNPTVRPSFAPTSSNVTSSIELVSTTGSFEVGIHDSEVFSRSFCKILTAVYYPESIEACSAQVHVHRGRLDPLRASGSKRRLQRRRLQSGSGNKGVFTVPYQLGVYPESTENLPKTQIDKLIRMRAATDLSLMVQGVGPEEVVSSPQESVSPPRDVESSGLVIALSVFAGVVTLIAFALVYTHYRRHTEKRELPQDESLSVYLGDESPERDARRRRSEASRKSFREREERAQEEEEEEIVVLDPVLAAQQREQASVAPGSSEAPRRFSRSPSRTGSTSSVGSSIARRDSKGGRLSGLMSSMSSRGGDSTAAPKYRSEPDEEIFAVTSPMHAGDAEEAAPPRRSVSFLGRTSSAPAKPASILRTASRSQANPPPMPQLDRATSQTFDPYFTSGAPAIERTRSGSFRPTTVVPGDAQYTPSTAEMYYSGGPLETPSQVADRVLGPKTPNDNESEWM